MQNYELHCMAQSEQTNVFFLLEFHSKNAEILLSLIILKKNLPTRQYTRKTQNHREQILIFTLFEVAMGF